MNSSDGRYFLKDSIRKTFNFATTAQNRGIAPPPVEKPVPPDARTIALIPRKNWKSIQPVSVENAIARRLSRRAFTRAALTLEELSFLLWATQGMREQKITPAHFRTVPSAGCRHAFETYLAAFRVEGLSRALYRYLPMSHRLVETGVHEHLESLVSRAALGQAFAGASAATFIWTVIPERMEWRYGAASYKVIAMDAGHVCQNLYLACEAIGAGTCAIGAYDQEFMDRLLGVDGEDEFAVYMAPVGKI